MLNENKIRWNPLSLVWHGLLATLVLFQLSMILLRSLLAVLQDKQQALYNIAILAHKYMGIATFFVVLIYLLGKLCGQFGGWRGAFPWLSSAGRSAIMVDVKSLAKLRLPIRTYGGGLAGVVQGLGLLLILGMAASGFSALLLWTYSNSHDLAAFIFAWHRYLAVLVWWFIGGHAGMTLLHRITPQRYWIVIPE